MRSRWSAPRPRAVVAGAVLAVALLTTSLTTGLTAPAVGGTPPGPQGTFVGIDGLEYATAPLVVAAPGGELFYGPDFDAACVQGTRKTRGLRAMTRLARVIERSGRRVVWTTAPSKARILIGRLADADLPHGSCDRRGFAEQDARDATYADPSYLAMTAPLTSAAAAHQTYWKTDPHWTTAGAAVFAQELAARLSPRLARHQHYIYSTETRVGLLNSFLDLDVPETAEAAGAGDHVAIATAPDSAQDWHGYPNGNTDYSWRARPAKRTWPGRTAIVGDSFSYLALPVLRPMFRHGRFVWIGEASPDDIVQAITDAHTVVLEVYQTFLQLGSPITTRSFRDQVQAALAKKDPGGTAKVVD